MHRPWIKLSEWVNVRLSQTCDITVLSSLKKAAHRSDLDKGRGLVTLSKHPCCLYLMPDSLSDDTMSGCLRAFRKPLRASCKELSKQPIKSKTQISSSVYLKGRCVLLSVGKEQRDAVKIVLFALRSGCGPFLIQSRLVTWFSVINPSNKMKSPFSLTLWSGRINHQLTSTSVWVFPTVGVSLTERITLDVVML